MINEFVCYKCKCDKCGHGWITKTHEVPVRCAKCNSVKWNEFSAPAAQIDAIRTPQIVQPSQPITNEPKDALAAFIAKAQASKGIVPSEIISEPEPIDEWIGWTEPAQTYDDQTGEMRTFRKHIKSGRVKWLDAESWIG